jgi:glucose-6-phosphate isomerase
VIKKNFQYKNIIQTKHFKKKVLKKISKNFNNVFKNTIDDINHPNKALNSLSENFKFNYKVKDLKKFKKFKTIALIGMGGSILGAEAIFNFLKKKIKKKIYFFDNLESDKLIEFKKHENLNKVLFIIISKSGSTIETLINSFLLNILKKNSENVILISEKKNNYLFSLSRKLNLFYVEHNRFTGGRFSIFSEVGSVPAYLMGLNLSKLRSQTLKFLNGKKKIFLKSSTIKLASLINSKKINNLILLCYSPELEKFLFWCQQLIAESLGKKGKGFLPLISKVPKDHHSLLQLYIDGPSDKLFYIFSLEKKSKQKIYINKFLDKNNFLNKKTLDRVQYAQKEALKKVFKKKNIPFREFKIKKINEETLSELFSYFILETVLIGRLIKVNPFDQPAVEQVKIFTKELLN